jgi:hypothetical protein
VTDEGTSVETAGEGELVDDAAPDVPFAFGCALWVPVFAVLLYFFTMFLRPRVSVDHAPPAEPE